MTPGATTAAASYAEHDMTPGATTAAASYAEHDMTPGATTAAASAAASYVVHGPTTHAPPSRPRDMYVVTVEDGEDGMLVAKCQQLNVITQGKTMDDVQRNAIEAIELMLEAIGKPREFYMHVKRKF